MQFRIQGKKVQCIRSAYDPSPGVKRSHQKLVASFDRWAKALPHAGLEELTDEEMRELAAWFKEQQAKEEEVSNQIRVENAASSLKHLAKSIGFMGAAMTDAEAAATWSALNDVAKALRKSGHRKPARQSVRPRPQHPGLLPDLLTDAA